MAGESISAMGNPDTWLPVGIGLLTFLLAYMGVHVTLYPPQGDARIRWALSFFAVAVTCCAFIAWQAVRSVSTQNELQARLDKIQQNTAQPPTVTVPVTVNPSFPATQRGADVVVSSDAGAYQTLDGGSGIIEPGKPVLINTFYVNNGNASADHFTGLGRIYIMPSESLESEKLAVAKFKDKMKQMLPGALTNVLPEGGKSTTWYTATSDQDVTNDDISKFKSGQEVLYHLDYVTWTDPGGKHFMQRCSVTQPPNGNVIVIGHPCHDFANHD